MFSLRVTNSRVRVDEKQCHDGHAQVRENDAGRSLTIIKTVPPIQCRFAPSCPSPTHSRPEQEKRTGTHTCLRVFAWNPTSQTLSFKQNTKNPKPYPVLAFAYTTHMFCDGFEIEAFIDHRIFAHRSNAKLALALHLCSEIAIQCQHRCKHIARCQTEMLIKPM